MKELISIISSSDDHLIQVPIYLTFYFFLFVSINNNYI